MTKVKKSGELTNVRRAPAAAGRQGKTGVRSGGDGAARPETSKRPAAKSGSKKSQAKPAAKGTAKGTAKGGARPAAKRVKPAARRATRPAGKATVKAPAKTAAPKRAPARKAPKRKATPVVVAQYKVRELNPQEKCGAGTSVERLIRVDEIMNKALQAHLVFLDRHGWYCEHGRTCPAVGHARRHARQDRNARNGTYNGRMRA